MENKSKSERKQADFMVKENAGCWVLVLILNKQIWRRGMKLWDKFEK